MNVCRTYRPNGTMSRSKLRIYVGQVSVDELPPDLFKLHGADDDDAGGDSVCRATWHKILVFGTMCDGSDTRLFQAEFMLSEIDYRETQYVHTDVHTETLLEERSSVDILSEAVIDAPSNVDADWWGRSQRRFAFNDCTQPTNIVNCPVENLESMFTANSGYGQNSVIKGAFPLSVFQRLQHIWIEYEAPHINGTAISMMSWYEDELRLCKQREKELLNMLVDRDRRTNIVFAQLSSKLPQGIILEHILPHFNNVKNMNNRESLKTVTSFCRNAQKKVEHLEWKL